MPPVNIDMPKLSDTMTEGTLIKWHKQVGDSIEIGDILADIETDKATMEMEAFDEGTITEIRVQEGEKAPIGSILAILNGAGEGAEPVADQPVTQPAASKEAAVGTDRVTASKAKETEPEARAPRQAAGVPTPGSSGRIKSSPLARKIAAAEGVDLANVRGTGPGGRIVKADVLAAKSQGGTPTSAPAKSTPVSQKPAAASAAAIMPVAKEGDERIELSSMRKIIASRLLTSKTTIPHFYLHLEVDVGPLMALRKQINDQAEKTHGNKFSLNDFILKATVNAALAVPVVNASFAGDHIVKFKHVGLSVAIAVDDGLVTPVIKKAEEISLLGISKAVKDFAVRAQDKKLKPDEFDGGTITVSNLGAWGIESFDAIVNPPQATILSVGAAVEKPVVVKGQIVPGLRMNIGLSCDHRVVDGAVGAAFLAEVKKLLEQPALMLL